VRVLVPIFALAVAVVGALADPSSIVDLILMAIPVAAFVLWTYRQNVPLWVVSLAVVVPVGVAQRSGSHEPLVFEVSVTLVRCGALVQVAHHSGRARPVGGRLAGRGGRD
jgi:hypothetical protein